MRNVPHSFRAIERWPGEPTQDRQHSRFKSNYSDTLDLLDRELWQLQAKDVVIELAVSQREIRQDGFLRADARVNHPGVILSFSSERTGPARFPCDTFRTWTENLRAIALSLEALRKIDRYGVTHRAEQYRGWSQLPPPGGIVTPPPMTVDEASRVLALGTGFLSAVILGDCETFKRAYRLRAMALHPDMNDGQYGAEWERLQKAADVLKRHHRIA